MTPCAEAATDAKSRPGIDGSTGLSGHEDEACALSAAAGQLGLALPADAVGRLIGYLDLLERWNRVYNLTAVRERGAMRIQHLNDSLAIAAALRRGVAGAAPRILDVGSGAGLPGLVVAICWPQAQITCVDAVGKKVAFVAQAAATLDLANVVAMHSRIESLPLDRPFDVVTARAFADLAGIVAATQRLLASDGVWALAKGRRPVAEIAAVGARVFHVEPLSVPELGADRHLVWIRTKPVSP